MITPDPSFRPDPDRAIYLQGEIDQAMISRHTSEIVKLKYKNLEPITVYIDSNGGDPILMERLLKLLLAADQDTGERCTIITIVTSQAASAAADLLSSGDYAYAYPGASLLYHGTRYTSTGGRPVTVTREWASVLSDYLRERNNVYAINLAKKIINRFTFRFIISRGKFDQIRTDYKSPNLNALGCFLLLVGSKLSAQGRTLLDKATKRYRRYDDLLGWLVLDEQRRTKRRKKPLTPREQDAMQIKAMIDFEFKDNQSKKDWSFQSDGIATLTDDFFMMQQYEASHRQGLFSDLAKRWGDFLMSDAEKQELKSLTPAQREIKKAEKTEPLFFPLFSFFIGLCYALQDGENELTASDAYWLGLIDEVFGEPHLHSARMISEYSPDPPQPNLPLQVAEAQPAALAEGEQGGGEKENADKEAKTAGTEAAGAEARPVKARR